MRVHKLLLIVASYFIAFEHFVAVMRVEILEQNNATSGIFFVVILRLAVIAAFLLFTPPKVFRLT